MGRKKRLAVSLTIVETHSVCADQVCTVANRNKKKKT